MEDDFDKYPLTGWFPGHMFKATKQMADALKLIDLGVELVDARALVSTRNPDLDRLLAGKPRVIVANKADLSSPGVNRAWERSYEEQDGRIHFLDSRRPANVKNLTVLWRQIVLEARAKRGVTRPLTRPIRIIISGVPNVGKSTLVNHLNEKNRAQVGPKPGVTRNNQWIPLDNGVELLDTPGILWPRILNKKHELMLALLGILNDELIPRELLAAFLAWKLCDMKWRVDWSEYGLDAEPADANQLLNAIAQKRGFLLSGGKADLERASISFIKDFREKKLGRISFEKP